MLSVRSIEIVLNSVTICISIRGLILLFCMQVI